MYYSFFTTKNSILKAYGGLFLLLASLYIQVELTVEINRWYGSFYDILQSVDKHTVSEFWTELGNFGWLAGFYVGIATASAYFARVYAFWWRERITFDAVELFRNSDKEVEGASQRIQEDAYRFAKIVESLGLQMVKALMTLIAFIPVLYGLSKNAQVPFMEGVEGSLVWVALIVSLGGIAISWIVGGHLPKIEFDIQKHEASFRKTLVWAEEPDTRLEHTKPDTILELFTGLKTSYRRLFNHYGYFDIWINIFEQIMVIVPYLLMGPALFTGAITLGVLVQTSNAFSKVRESFSIVVQNWTNITELRSIHMRLVGFEREMKVRV